jgi:hypothetical protein
MREFGDARVISCDVAGDDSSEVFGKLMTAPREASYLCKKKERNMLVWVHWRCSILLQITESGNDCWAVHGLHGRCERAPERQRCEDYIRKWLQSTRITPNVMLDSSGRQEHHHFDHCQHSKHCRRESSICGRYGW